ncbi:SGNH/GDSL hydrolase family protein [Streptomyces liangshanensis]|uniref:hypothetical protein n=1 Tax=Streptomyces liangshanensis TaxID=2717324 RepID=UPI0036D78FB8
MSDSNFHASGRRRHHVQRRRLVFAALCALLLPPLSALASAPPATADSGSPTATQAPSVHDNPPHQTLGTFRPPDDSGLTGPQRTALASAKKRATSTGQVVTVDALTTETSTTTVNPSGNMTYNSSLLPVRVRDHDHWVPVDATLHQNADGTWSPKAAAEPLSFSSGGSTPMVTMTSGKATLAMSWPAPLPTPQASGAHLTYPSVLPGVDLQLSADTRGGFSQLLIVKTAEAAANPDLATLELTTKTSGVTVTDDNHGNLAATTPDGRILFSAPQPVMWDSTTPRKQTAVTAAVQAPDAPIPSATARVARVAPQADDSILTLTPDQDLLHGPTTTYPVYIDPTWNPHFASSTRQHFIEVQQGCSTAKNYDSTQYGDPGVGYNAFSGCIGTERSYFQLAVPSAIWGTHIVSATIDAQENYSASCSLSANVALYWSGAISAGTTWSNKPALSSNLGSKSFGPACTSHPSGGYAVTSTIAKGAAAHWKSWTFALVSSQEASSDGNYFKRFASNPSMSITYNHVPTAPSSLSAKVGSTALGCGTTSPYPIVGKTLATTPPTLNAVISDGDKDSLAATYSYWAGAGSATTAASATVASGQNAPKQLPSTFMSGLADGSLVSWKVTSSDGKDTSPTSSTCHFTVDLHSPAQPTIKTADSLYPEDSAGITAAGTPGKFVLSVAPGTTGNNAAKFLYGVDTSPVTSGTPAAQTVAATNNTATVSVTPVAPGTHTLYAYAVDSAGNVSSQQQYEFTALGHATTTYTSLQAAFNNTAVTDNAATDVKEAFDGLGSSFSLQDFKAAGWQPGGKITIDGASFTLPAFGSANGDNVMAANQTIQMNGTAGKALVFLAASDNGLSSAPDPAGELTSPAVLAGVPIAGTNCTLGNGTYEDCIPPTGTINYGGSVAPQAYNLAAPDWVSGPKDMATVTLPHRNTRAGQQTIGTSVYAFAVPLKPGAPINSVTLPDLSSAARPNIPGLHIFGMAVRDTTIAPGGHTWTGAWSSPTQGQYSYFTGGFNNQTIRMATTPSVSGSTVRIRLSDALGHDPLVLGHVTVAQQVGGAKPSATPQDLTFNGGSTTVTIPEGGEIYSDPVAFPVTAGKGLMLSLHLSNHVPYLGVNTFAAATMAYITATASGDHTKDSTDTAFVGSGTISSYMSAVLTGVDVITSEDQPTVSVIEGLPDASRVGGGGTVRVSDDLASRLQQNTEGVPHYGVVASGIESNGITANYKSPSLLTRLDRDILSTPGISTVVVSEGLEDLLGETDDTTLEAGYSLLRDQLKGWGIKVVFMNLLPCATYDRCTDAVDANRTGVNTWISDQVDWTQPYTDQFDAESIVSEPWEDSPLDPPALAISYYPVNYGGGVTLSNLGYAAIADRFPLSALQAETGPQG